MHAALVVVHVLAASVWIGGTVALVFTAVPVLRKLPREQRADSVRALGRRWKPIGWGSLLVVGGTGIGLAFGFWNAGDTDFLFHTRPGHYLVAKALLYVTLVASAATHDFVLGPRLNRQIREGRQLTFLRPMQAVGWVSFAATVALPVLGALLTS